MAKNKAQNTIIKKLFHKVNETYLVLAAAGLFLQFQFKEKERSRFNKSGYISLRLQEVHIAAL
jgi:hypothetical protein